MSDQRARYVRLAPLDVDLEANIARLAIWFFSPINYRNACKAIGKSPSQSTILPMTASDFITLLNGTDFLREPADKYIYLIRHLLRRLVASNILVEIGISYQNVMIPGSYYALIETTERRNAGSLWLARSLGGRFIHRQIAPSIMHITGRNCKGDVVAGSGIVFDSCHVLTCRHVVSDMRVDQEQVFQGKKVSIQHIAKHERDDVAVVRVDGPLDTVPGLAFLSPVIAQTVYTFGYPRIPNVRPKKPDSNESYLVMQSGEVTNDSVIGSNGTELFLYSATSRPGDSGGAIVSDDGYVVGVSTVLARGDYKDEDVFAPHYAGIPAHVAASAVDDMGLGIEVPFETFD